MAGDRHAVDHDHVEDWYEMAQGSLAAGLEFLTQAPENLPEIGRDAEDRFACAALLDPDDDALYECARAAVAAYVAVFEAASASKGTVSVELEDHVYTIPATGPSGGAHARNWRWAFFLAVVDRNRDALDRLAAVPLDVIRRSTSRSPEYSYLYVEALQAFWRKDADTIDRFMAALEATDPNALGPFPADFALRIIVPQLELWFRFLTRDQDGFDQALEEAVTLHRKYWGSSADRRREPEGWVATGPLAVASLAHDTGMHISVRSDYLPTRLVRGV